MKFPKGKTSSYSKIIAMLVMLLCSCVEEGLVTAENTPKATPTTTEEVTTEYGINTKGYEISRQKLKMGQTMGQIMNKWNRSAVEVYEMEKAAKEVFSLRDMKAGQTYATFTTTDSEGKERLDYIVYEKDPVRYVIYDMSGESPSVREGAKEMVVKRRKCEAVIESSLWGEIMKQDLPYALGSEIENIYQWSVDFFGIRKGDSFSVVYEEIFVNDTISVGLGKIIGAKFTQGTKDYYAISFSQDGHTEYWDEKGGSLRKQLLKAPLKYSRISSRYTNSRLHPVLKVYRPHHGVDYAAPMGTPVYAVADGVITYRGYDRASGNMIKIKHANSIQTGYLHLSRFAKGIYKGSRVKQSDLIGYVGSTGYSTGPHLDYRIWISGKPVNPLSIAQRPSKPIAKEHVEDFNIRCQSVIAEIEGREAKKDVNTNSYGLNFDTFLSAPKQGEQRSDYMTSKSPLTPFSTELPLS